MSGARDDVNFKWLGDEVECPDPKWRSRSRIFYGCCTCNRHRYDAGDYAIAERNRRKEVCKILCMYESQETGRRSRRFCAVVRWYTWARNVRVFSWGPANPKNEVVEDLTRTEEVIGLEQLTQKCYVFFTTPDDPDCSHLKFGDLYFPCRYKLTEPGLVPIISESMSPALLEEIERAHLTPSSKKKTKRKTSEETIVILREDSPQLGDVRSTPRGRVSFRRNLNESFGSPRSGAPLLNYSIIGSSESEDETLKLKLRVSSRRTPGGGRAKSQCPATPSRKSNRVTKRVSYADCNVSPVRKTPSKRGELKSCAGSPSKRRTSSVSAAGDGDKGSPKKMPKLSRSDVARSVSDFLGDETEISPAKRDLTESLFSDLLLKSAVCEIKQLTRVHVTPKKSAKRGARHGDDGAALKSRTPRARVKLLREGLITPSMQVRSTPVKGGATPLDKARTRLHVSHVPNALPCREKQFEDVFGFVEGKLLDKCGGCMYVSGVPGTGKTATVTEVVKQLQALAQADEIPGFKCVHLNGMKLTEPRQSYVEILRQLTGMTLAWEHAQNALDVKFTKAGKKCEPIVLVVDELDILCTKRQDVVYNLLDWPSRANMPLIIIAIANTMDLPERLLMGRVTSRLGLTRLTFQAYTHKQLQEIVAKRLTGTDAFNPDAVQFVARKVASVSGDARRALDICRRAAEIAERDKGGATLVSMCHVNEAIEAMITQPKIRAIKRCTRLQQLILQAAVSEVERTGVEETTFSDVFTMLASVASLDGFKIVSATVALRAVSYLGACRLLLLDQKSADVHQKMILNVSAEDVYYALRRD